MKCKRCLLLLPFIAYIVENNLSHRWPIISILMWNNSSWSAAEIILISRKSRLFEEKVDFYDLPQPYRRTSRVLGPTPEPKVCGGLPWGSLLHLCTLTCSHIHVYTRVFRSTHHIIAFTFINTLIQAPSNRQSSICTHKFACKSTLCCSHFSTLFEIVNAYV